MISRPGDPVVLLKAHVGLKNRIYIGELAIVIGYQRGGWYKVEVYPEFGENVVVKWRGGRGMERL